MCISLSLYNYCVSLKERKCEAAKHFYFGLAVDSKAKSPPAPLTDRM